MRNNKIIIISVIALMVLLLSYSFIKATQAKGTKIDMDDTYPKPIIALLIVGNKSVKFNAGMYRYGDITQDGIIDDMDIDFVNLLINNKLTFRDEQKLLADINKDGVVNQIDVDLLKELIEKNGEITYDIQADRLLYCVSLVNDYSNCTWQEQDVVNDLEEKVYYAFTKLKDSDSVSNDYSFKYVTIKEKIIR